MSEIESILVFVGVAVIFGVAVILNKTRIGFGTLLVIAGLILILLSAYLIR